MPGPVSLTARVGDPSARVTRTVIVTGVSVNVAVTNLVMDAVNAGYQVVLPRDAVCGLPADYADAVIDQTLALLATVTTVDDVVAAWAPTEEDLP